MTEFILLAGFAAIVGVIKIGTRLRFRHEIIIPMRDRKLLIDWMVDNLSHEWKYVGVASDHLTHEIFRFESVEDAILFKLRWV